MYKIVFSIAAHERYESIVDLVENLNKFNNNCLIIIHLSTAFCNNSLISEEKFNTIINGYENVVLNPNRQKTSLFSQFLVHFVNFCYAKQNFAFEYFSISSSNDLYLKEGFYESVRNFDYLNEPKEMKRSKWVHFDKAKNDPLVQTVFQKNNVSHFLVSYLEGTIYKKDIFDRICSNFTLEELQSYIYKYPVDELVITSLCFKYSSNGGYGRAIKNGVGRLFVNRRTIKKVLKSSNKFGVKRINRDFYDYQRVFIRERITKDLSVYQTLGLKTTNTNPLIYYFKDLWGTIIARLTSFLSIGRFKLRLFFRKKSK